MEPRYKNIVCIQCDLRQFTSGKYGQTMHVLKVLPSQGLSDAALKDIYRSVVLAKLLYASPA